MKKQNGKRNGNYQTSIKVADNNQNGLSDFFQGEHLFELMVESAVEYAIFAIDKNGRIANWNAGAERIFGYREDEIIGEELAVLFTEQDCAANAPLMQMEKASQTGSAADDRWMRKADGKTFWASGKLMALKDDSGNFRGFVKIVRDQTERKLAVDSLNSSDLRFQEVIRQSPLSTFVQDGSGRIEYVNPAFTRLWDVTLADLSEYNPLEDEQAEALGIKPYIERAFAGEPVEIPPILYDPKKTKSVGGGKSCWVRTFAYPIKDENDRVLQVVTTHEDVTERIKAEAELSASKQRLAFALKAGRAGTFEWNIKEDYNVWSPELEELYGVQPGTFEGSFDSWHKRVVKEDADRIVADIEKVLAQKGEDYTFEFRAVLPDGTHRWLAGRAQFVYDDENNPKQMVGINFDITDRKRIEEALKRSREHYEALVMASTQIFWTTDDKGRVTADSPSWRYFTGQTVEEWLKMGWDVIHPDDRESSRQAWEKAIKESSNYEGEYRIRHKSGEYRWMAVRGVPLKNDDGSVREWVGMNTDIHERKRAEAALRDSHARREFLLKSSKIGEWELDLETGKAQRTFLHDQCFGATEPFDEWSYDTFLSYVHPDDRAEVERSFDESIAGQKVWDFECRVIWKDGSLHWIHAQGDFYRQSGETKPTRMVGIVTEITEQKQAVEALRASEEFNRSVIASSPDCFKILDFDGRLQFMNDDGFCLMEIDDFSLFKGQIWVDFWQDEDRVLAIAAVEKAKSGQVGKFQGFCRTAKGTPKWWDVVIAPVRGASGEIVRLLSISRDITANKLADEEREELREREMRALKGSELERKKLESLFKQSPAVINITSGPEHVFELTHPRMPELLGDRDYLNRPIKEVFPESDYEPFIELMNNVYRTGETYFGTDTPIWLNTPEGRREGYFDFIYQAWRDIEGEIGGVLSLGVEVTDRVLARKAMERAAVEQEAMLEREQQLRKTAEDASRMKDEFLATVSHELRTPLNAILGWSQMMRSGVVKVDQYEKAIETIDRNARSQAQLIDDLLDITRIVTGKLRLNLEETNFPSIINSAVQTVRPAAQAKNIGIFVELPSEQTEILGDAERLQQVIWNLLSNAVKFTSRGGEIFVALETKGSHLKLSVRDTGEGIEPEFLPFVFDRFTQSDMSSTRRKGGLGLGLSIVRHLVEMHGGSVSVASEGKGSGTTFTIFLPFKTEYDEVEQEKTRATHYPDSAGNAPTVRLDGVAVLVVDDEPDACEVLKILLEQCGATVTTANSVKEALELMAVENPKILVSDIAMPDEDGYSLIRKIRELPKEEGGGIPAIALTAYASQSDRKRALDAGFQSHVTKPVNQNALVTILASLV